MPDTDVAGAIAFFESTTDLALLHEVLRTIRPRASAEVRRYERAGRPVPSPDAGAAAADPAGQTEALQTVRSTKDFAQIQALARAVGRRIEALMEADHD